MAKTIIPILSPANDFGIVVRLVEPANGVRAPQPITTGVATGFFATTETASGPAHATLVCEVTHVGNGYWTVILPGTTTRATLDPVLVGQQLFLIIQHPGNVDFVVECIYQSVRRVTIPAV